MRIPSHLITLNNLQTYFDLQNLSIAKPTALSQTMEVQFDEIGCERVD
jgi:hypothetical protein